MAQIVKVRDAMSTDVLEIEEDANLQAAAKRMADARVNSLIVRPEGKEEPFGIITSTDIVDAIARNQDPVTTLVRETAVAPLVVVTPGVPLAYAARLMKRGNLRHLAVFNGRQIVGVLSAHDVVKAVGQWGSLLGRTATRRDEAPPVSASP
ncbi:MAG TPA: CBS domain-containing protein [Thermoplasmata archaeon]|nr:CBS domain-containing protein [Thermoplasmata archaeon]